jgi:hypothetical protein
MPDYHLMPDRLDDDLLRYAMECSGMNNPDGAATVKAIYRFLLEAAATNAEVKAARQRAQSIQAMADCMDMVKCELVQAGVVEEDVPPMFLADAVLARMGRERNALYAVAALLQEAVNRLDDILQGDDGQAWKEAERALPDLRFTLPARDAASPLNPQAVATIEREYVAALPGPGYLVQSALGIAARMCDNGLTMKAREHLGHAGRLIEYYRLGMDGWPDVDDKETA